MHALVSIARRFAYAAALLFVVVPAVQAQDTPQRGGTLVMVVQPEPPTLASYQSTAGPIGQVAS
ncbi:MAG TPA: ABC transporter substrate-binding protein, partial [Casimicrobiaceae bacterium]